MSVCTVVMQFNATIAECFVWRCDEWLFQWKWWLWTAVSAGSWQSCCLWMLVGISTGQQPPKLYKYMHLIVHMSLQC